MVWQHYRYVAHYIYTPTPTFLILIGGGGNYHDGEGQLPPHDPTIEAPPLPPYHSMHTHHYNVTVYRLYTHILCCVIHYIFFS